MRCLTAFFRFLGYNSGMRLLVNPASINLTDKASHLTDLLEPS